MTLRQLPASILLIALIALIGGCGSDSEATGDETGGSTSANESAQVMPKGQFLTKAVAICMKRNKAQEPVIEEFRQLGKEAEADGKVSAAEEQSREEIVAKIFRNARQTLDELTALGYPEGDERVMQAFLDEYTDALKQSEDSPATYFSGEAFFPVGESGESYGLVGCF
jgi:type IV pilus biogenesis protein CpaD/CtpE